MKEALIIVGVNLVLNGLDFIDEQHARLLPTGVFSL